MIFIIWIAGSAAAQEDTLKARVTVLPLTNEIGDSQYDVISRTITDTIELTLELLGSYTVVELSSPSGQLSVETLNQFARANRLDNVIFGETTRRADGTIVFDVSVYDRVENEIILGHQETAASFFDTFDAADAMVVSIVESFSDTHIGWGTIVLANEGTRGDFDIYVDGTYFGSSKKSLPNILIGPRKITLRQDRPFGEVTIAEEVIQVIEEETSIMIFSIDSVTPMETSGFGAIEQAIRNVW